MENQSKTCTNCRYSYYAQDRSRHPNIGLLRQHCKSKEYNSAKYTQKMFEEDRKGNHCRFWAPIDEKKNKGEKDNEEQLLGRGA